MGKSIYGIIGRTVGTVASLAHPVYNAAKEMSAQHRYVEKTVTRSITENATTGGIGGAVGAMAMKSAAGPAGAAGAAAGVAVGLGKAIHDSWYETKVVSALTGAAKAVAKEAWNRYTE